MSIATFSWVRPKHIEALPTNTGLRRAIIPTHHEKLVTQTQKWVGLTFFGPMLKEMRNSPFKSDMLDGGRGGQAFAEMYDDELAQRLTRGSGAKLVNSIVHRVEAKEAYSRQAKAAINSEREGADRVRAASSASIAGAISRSTDVEATR